MLEDFGVAASNMAQTIHWIICIYSNWQVDGTGVLHIGLKIRTFFTFLPLVSASHLFWPFSVLPEISNAVSGNRSILVLNLCGFFKPATFQEFSHLQSSRYTPKVSTASLPLEQWWKTMQVSLKKSSHNCPRCKFLQRIFTLATKVLPQTLQTRLPSTSSLKRHFSCGVLILLTHPLNSWRGHWNFSIPLKPNRVLLSYLSSN